MPSSKPDWLTQLERKKNASIFLLEWILLFNFGILLYASLFFNPRNPVSSCMLVASLSGLYACALMYQRLRMLTSCRKCHSVLPLGQEEIGRRHIRDEEHCVQVEHGGAEWMEHWIATYCGIHRIEIVRLRCRRCRAVWDAVERSAESNYELIRTINLKN